MMYSFKITTFILSLCNHQFQWIFNKQHTINRQTCVFLNLHISSLMVKTFFAKGKWKQWWNVVTCPVKEQFFHFKFYLAKKEKHLNNELLRNFSKKTYILYQWENKYSKTLFCLIYHRKKLCRMVHWLLKILICPEELNLKHHISTKTFIFDWKFEKYFSNDDPRSNINIIETYSYVFIYIVLNGILKK